MMSKLDLWGTGRARLPAGGTSGRSLIASVGLRDRPRRSSDRLPATGCLRPRPGSPRVCGVTPQQPYVLLLFQKLSVRTALANLPTDGWSEPQGAGRTVGRQKNGTAQTPRKRLQLDFHCDVRYHAASWARSSQLLHGFLDLSIRSAPHRPVVSFVNDNHRPGP